jgi:hypothetical protein
MEVQYRIVNEKIAARLIVNFVFFQITRNKTLFIIIIFGCCTMYSLIIVRMARRI